MLKLSLPEPCLTKARNRCSGEISMGCIPLSTKKSSRDIHVSGANARPTTVVYVSKEVAGKGPG